MNKEILTNDDVLIKVWLPILLAFLGFFAKYLNDLRIAKRKDKLDRVNRQLKEFYGPLFSLTSSSNATWIVFRKKYRNQYSSYFDKTNPPSEKEREVWRTWVTAVFQPINEKIYNLIITNGDLIIEDELPQPLKDLCSHFESYKPIIKQWNNENFAEHLSLINYPLAIIEYSELSYKNLKVKQSQLIE